MRMKRIGLKKDCDMIWAEIWERMSNASMSGMIYFFLLRKI